MKPADYEMVIISHLAGISNGCLTCKKVFAEGKYAIGLRIKEPNQEYQYIVGVTPPVVCCGTEKKVWILAKTMGEAEAKAAEIADYLNKHETTEGLRLFVTDLDF